MHWLITGGCGFIGSALVTQLRARGERVSVFDNCSVGDPGVLPGDVPLVRGDIRDADAVTAAAAGTDVIVHLAAQTGVPGSIEAPRIDCETNVLGTLNALEAARACGVSRFVFASSGAPAGAVEPPIHENIVPRPVAPYGASKLAGEAYCSAWFHAFGINTVALRFGNVYGPGSGHKGSVVAQFIRDALAGRALTVYGDGSQTRDYVFVTDLIDAIDKAAAAADTVGGEVFQIATAAETSVTELVELLRIALEREGVTPPAVVHAAMRRGDVARNFADTTKARERLGWQASTEIADGLAQTIRWFRQRLPRD